MGAIGGADLAQAAARARHDRGNAERSADFDELAARHDHLLARRESSEHQQNRGGVVVHHRGGLSAGEFGEQRFDMGVAVATRAGCQVVLEIARLRHDRMHGFDGLRRQQCPPEIGVQHCAGEVEHAPQRGLKRGLEVSLEVSRERRRLPRFRGQRGTLQHGLAHFGEQGTDGVDDGGVAILCGQCLHRRHLEHTIDRRQYSSNLRIPRLDQGQFRL